MGNAQVMCLNQKKSLPKGLTFRPKYAIVLLFGRT